ncbi:hypothetical protein [Halogeometricum luteum]|uniref:Maf family bZIP transcription factor n=1 Tax=Halogeometricum luteum TaxID=2950537 RepID=A0ABU2G1Y2_9EURY|nr:hypothetical protein [Halogeometricum sp. S3BR5-2]MDS0294783.1 Maf family bZIP transcription factor [Halogeometricum sp. S3BR5-2]
MALRDVDDGRGVPTDGTEIEAGGRVDATTSATPNDAEPPSPEPAAPASAEPPSDRPSTPPARPSLPPSDELATALSTEQPTPPAADTQTLPPTASGDEAPPESTETVAEEKPTETTFDPEQYTVHELRDRLPDVTTTEELERLLSRERDGKNRETAKAAIRRRLCAVGNDTA